MHSIVVLLAALLAWDVSLARSIEDARSRALEADRACQSVPEVPITRNESSSSSTITGRPVVLCAFSERTATWHEVVIRLPYPIPREHITCLERAESVLARKACALQIELVTQGYRIEHLRGYGVTRFSVDLYRFGSDGTEERLMVYRYRHAWFDDAALASGSVEEVLRTATYVAYTPFHDEFMSEDAVRAGLDFLKGRVDTARDTLRARRVPSQAYEDRMLSDVVPWEIPMALAIIEQIDDKHFDEDPTRTVRETLVEYALNEDQTFMWSQSRAFAIGALQFTNTGGDGTYSSVVRRCDRAGLDPEFPRGARDLPNVLLAAICLIDIEVAQFPTIKRLFFRSPILAGIYPVAAYNGSPAAARALYEWMKRRGVDVERSVIRVPDALHGSRVRQCPCADIRGRTRSKSRIIVRVVNTETPGYVRKYIHTVNFLEDIEWR